MSRCKHMFSRIAVVGGMYLFSSGCMQYADEGPEVADVGHAEAAVVESSQLSEIQQIPVAEKQCLWITIASTEGRDLLYVLAVGSEVSATGQDLILLPGKERWFEPNGGVDLAGVSGLTWSAAVYGDSDDERARLWGDLNATSFIRTVGYALAGSVLWDAQMIPTDYESFAFGADSATWFFSLKLAGGRLDDVMFGTTRGTEAEPYVGVLPAGLLAGSDVPLRTTSTAAARSVFDRFERVQMPDGWLTEGGVAPPAGGGSYVQK